MTIGFLLVMYMLFPFLEPVLSYFSLNLNPSKQSILRYLGVILAFIVIQVLNYLLYTYVNVYLMKKIYQGQSNVLSSLSESFSKCFFRIFVPGDAVNRVQMGTMAVATVLVTVSKVCGALIAILIGVVCFFQISIGLSLSFAGIILLEVGKQWFLYRKNTDIEQQVQQLESEREGKLKFLIDYEEELSAFHYSEPFQREYRELRKSCWQKQKQKTYLTASVNEVCEVLSSVLLVFSLLQAVPMHQEQAAGAVISIFILSFVQVMKGVVTNLSAELVQLPNIVVAVNRLDEMLAYDARQEDVPDLQQNRALIELEGICLKKENKTILSNLSFNIQAGEKVMITGENGSGKSSLVDIITGEETEYQGKCRVGGRSATTLDLPLRRSCFSYIPAQAMLFQTDGRHNISLGTDKEISQQDMMLVTQIAEIQPAMLEQSANELSGGEQQRINIGRAAVQEGCVLLADEPTSSLDAGKAHHIIKTLTERFETCIVVTHDPSLERYFTRKITICQGEIAADERIEK